MKNSTSYILSFVFHYLKSLKYKYLPSSTIFFCLFTLTVSIASLIIVKSVMNGFRRELIESIISVNAHINLYSKNGNLIKDFKKDLDFLETFNKDIESISPSLTSSGMISINGYSNGIIIKSFQEDNLKNKGNKFNIIGNFKNDFEKNKGIIIGIELAARMGIRLDNIVNITVPKVIDTAIGSYLVNKGFKIVGFLKTGSTEYDSSIVLLPSSEYRNIFQINKNEVSEIGIYLKNYEDFIDFENKISKLKDKYRIRNWQIENYGLINALKTESAVMSIILSLFILISMTGIFVVINNMVKEKEKEIGIMYSMGVLQSEVLLIFFLISLLITVISLILGLTLGIFLALKLDTIRIYLENIFHFRLFDSSVYLLSRLPSRIETFDVVWTICFVFILSILFGIFPALRASRKNPVEILRGFSS